MKNMIYQLPIPKTPEIFENLVCDLTNKLFNTTSFSLYGRKGQNQKGIDIVSYEKHIVIQCKLRTLNLNKRKTKIEFVNEIITDINQSIQSKNIPNKFIIATTLENDTLIQDYLNTLMIFHKIKVNIEFWSWSKISNEIFLFPSILNKYYPFRGGKIEFARIDIRNSSVYRKSKENQLLFHYKNIKRVNQLPIFDLSLINNTENTILLNSIDCYCSYLAIARGGTPPTPNEILEPTEKFIIDFNLVPNLTFGKYDKQSVKLKDPIFVSPKSPLRILIQNKKALVNYFRIYFQFNFNSESIISPEIFINSDNRYSGNIVTKL